MESNTTPKVKTVYMVYKCYFKTNTTPPTVNNHFGVILAQEEVDHIELNHDTGAYIVYTKSNDDFEKLNILESHCVTDLANMDTTQYDQIVCFPYFECCLPALSNRSAMQEVYNREKSAMIEYWSKRVSSEIQKTPGKTHGID